MHTQFLFVYGTLLIADNQFAIYLQNNSTFYSKGKFKGKLYDANDYPVAITDKTGSLYVHGSVVKLNDAETTLKHIDPYEGYGDGQPKPYLYLRKLIPIEMDNEVIDCWVYIYNRSVEDMEQIASGDYISYLKNKKSL